MVGVVAKNIVKPDKIEDFLEVTRELISETRREKGCIEYTLMRDSERENILTFIEKWESMDHLKAHFEAPHFKRVVPMLVELVEGECEVNIYEEV